MATGPKVATSPLELLENDGTREPPLLSKIYGPTACAAAAFLSVVYANWATKRPFFSGIQRHAIATVAGAAIGKVLEDYRAEYYADKDAVLRHYIQLHPEDFPAYERKKIGETFEPWIPIR